MTRDDAKTAPGHGRATPGDDVTAETAGTDDSFLREVAGTPALDPGPMPGDVIDDSFRVEKTLGAGGMGVVYLATDLRLHREVAIKLHAPGPAMAARTEREAKVMARLTHPNVVTVYEVGAWRDRIYIAMEYCDGGTLRTWLAARRHTWREVLARFLAAARGLAAAHAAGLVHRDFKPDNVLLGNDGRVRVADFGVARPARGGAPELPVPAGSIARSLTAAGAVVGTPGYMAPEAERGDEVDARADQYSYCIALRRALAPSRPPRWIGRILARGLDADPARRWPSMDALVGELERTRRRRRVAIAGGVGAIALVGALAAVLATRASPDRRCTGAAEAFAGTWSPERAATVHDAVAGALDAAAADEVVATIDRWGHAWIDMHHDACMASTVRGEQSPALLDQRMSCLERGRAQLDAAVALMSQSDGGALHAHEEVDALPEVARCGDVATLSALPPRPADLGGAARLAQLEAEHAALVARGPTDSALAYYQAYQALLPRVRAIGWQPLIAQVELDAGRAADAAGVDAHDLFTAAATDAVASHDDPIAVAAWTALGADAETATDDTGAGTWFSLARAGIDRGAVPIGVELELDLHVVQRNRLNGRPVETLPLALLVHRRSLDTDDHDLQQRAQLEIVVVQLTAGRPEDARRTLSDALAEIERHAAPDSDILLVAHMWQAYTDDELGHYDAAIADGKRVVEQVQRYRSDSARVADTLSKVAAVFSDARDVDDEQVVLQDAQRILNAEPDSDLARLGEVLVNLSTIESARGDTEKGYRDAIRAYEMLEKAPVTGDSDLISAALITAGAAQQSGRSDEALKRYEAALVLARSVLPPTNAYRLAAERETAFQRLYMGKAAEAIEPAEEAERGYQNREPQFLAETRFTLAQALWIVGVDRARALQLGREARDGYASLGASFDSQRTAVSAWLAGRGAP